MAPADDFDRAAAALAPLVAALTPDELARPTPCAAWDVRALVNHVVFGLRLFAASLRGEPLVSSDALARLRQVDQLAYDPSAAYLAAVAAFRDALGRPEVAGRTFATPIGPIPADGVAQMRVNELLVHGWDLARALGRPAARPDDLAEQSLGRWRERIASMPREPGSPFGVEQPVPGAAPAIDRLAAFLGRSVA